MELPRRDAAPRLRRRRDPHPLRRRSRRRRAVLRHQHAPGAERVRARHPLLDDRRDQRFQHQPGAAQPQVRDAPLRGGDRRMPRHEVRGVVLAAQHRRQHVDELRRAGSPRHTLHGVGPRAADPGGDRAGGQQAGPPDRAVARARKQGSPRPRRRGARVCPKLTAPGNTTVRALLFTRCSPICPD
ncbi:hypothetical protein I549_0816 [Mycobacterium avium subsp. avium 2285 (R)]|nr:hypothetical protein I549_0816 [Mycobacterium avium subsp. avium 2285 (R)]